MKYLIWIAFTAFLFFGCKKEDDEMIVEPAPSVPIVLTNTGIELVDNAGIPIDWWYRAGPYDLFTTDTTAFNGNQSAGLTSSDSTSADFGYWAQSTSENIQSGRKLRLRVNIKTENVIGEGASIVIRGDDAPAPAGNAELFESTEGDIFIGGTHNWKEYRVTLERPISPSIQSITVFVVLLPYTTGTVFFDDVILEYE